MSRDHWCALHLFFLRGCPVISRCKCGLLRSTGFYKLLLLFCSSHRTCIFRLPLCSCTYALPLARPRWIDPAAQTLGGSDRRARPVMPTTTRGAAKDRCHSLPPSPWLSHLEVQPLAAHLCSSLPPLDCPALGYLGLGEPGQVHKALIYIRILVSTTLVDCVHSVGTFAFSCTDPAAVQPHFLACGHFFFT